MAILLVPYLYSPPRLPQYSNLAAVNNRVCDVTSFQGVQRRTSMQEMATAILVTVPVFGGLAGLFVRARILEYKRAVTVLRKELTLAVLDFTSFNKGVRHLAFTVGGRGVRLLLLTSKLGKTRWQRYVLRKALQHASMFPGTSVISSVLLEVDYGTLRGWEWIKALIIPGISQTSIRTNLRINN